MEYYRVGSTFPDMKLKTTEGDIDLYEWMENSWLLLFCYVDDCSKDCYAEIVQLVTLYEKYQSSNLKILAASCNTIETHEKLIKDIKRRCAVGGKFPFPIVADTEREMLRKLHIADDKKDEAQQPLMCRAVYIVKPEKEIMYTLHYPSSLPRNFTELRRVVKDLIVRHKENIDVPKTSQEGK